MVLILKLMNDKKKFWLITSVYLFLFWVLPLQPLWIDSFFGFLDNLFLKIGVDVESVLIYFFIIVPLIIILSYLLIRKLNLKFKKDFFILMYIVIPYLIILSYFFYALNHISFFGFL